MKYWRIAHARIYSGKNNAHRYKGIVYVRKPTNDLRSLSSPPIPGSSEVDDILGCRETQVQRNIVDRQLQMMFQIVRVWMSSS